MADAAGSRQSSKACHTCRVRHVKCDRVKPLCQQCGQTGRLCDGYANLPRPKVKPLKLKVSSGPPRIRRLATRPHESHVAQKSSSVTTSSVVAHAQKDDTMTVVPFAACMQYSPKTLVNDEDEPTILAFGHFWHRTVPAMHGVFEPDEWFQALCVSSTASTPVLNACAALSLFHQLSECDEQLGKQNQQNIRNQALHHYVHALRETQAAVQLGSMSRVSMKLLCILFTLTESIQGHRDSARSHFQSSVALQAATSNSLSITSSAEESLDATLFRLGIGQTLYGRPRGAIFPRVTLPPQIASHTYPTTTASETHQSNVHSARNALYACIATTLALIRQPYQSMFPETAPFATTKQSVQSQLTNWLTVHAPTLRSASANSTSGRYASNLLLAYHATLEICVAALDLGDQTSFDAHTAKFETVVRLLSDTCLAGQHPQASTTKPKSTPPSFPGSFMDTGILTQLFLTATKCRAPSLRRRAVALMAYAPAREGMWDAAQSATVASAVIRHEEQMLALAGQKHLEKSWRSMLINERRVTDVDMRDADDGAGHAVVVVLRCTNGEAVEIKLD